MRASILSPEFAMATKRAAKFTAKRSHLPVLNNVLLETAEDELWLTSTDLEVALVQKIRARVDEPGALTIPAGTLAEMAGRADSEITEIVTEDRTATITGGRQSSRISGIDAADFPPIPQHFEMATATIDASEIDHHESDLYVKRTQASQAIVMHCNRSGIGCFRHQGDKAPWWDIPFAYEPFWEKGVIA